MITVVLVVLVALAWVVGVLCGGYSRCSARDRFAQAALVAWLPTWKQPGVELRAIARDCFRVADAMMKERGDD